MKAELLVTLGLPPKELSPNYRSRSHWPRTRATADYRHEAKIMVKQAIMEQYAEMELKAFRDAMPFARATVTATFFPTDKRSSRDRDNLLSSLKAAFDGMQVPKGKGIGAGLIADDRALTHMPVQIHDTEGEQSQPRVEIFLELER